MNPENTQNKPSLDAIFGSSISAIQKTTGNQGKPSLDDIFLDRLPEQEKKKFDVGYSNTGQELKQAGSEIVDTIKGTGQKIAEAQRMSMSGEQSPIESGFQMAGAIASGVSGLAGNIVKGAAEVALPQEAETAIKAGIATGVQKASDVLSKYEQLKQTKPALAGAINLVLGSTPEATLGVIDLVKGYDKLKTTNPRLARNLDAALGIGELALDVATLGGAKAGTTALKTVGKEAGEALAEQGAKGVTQAITETVETVAKQGVSKGKQAVSSVVKAVTPESEMIMNRVARLNPTDAKKFEQIAGKSHGKYLEETGNFGTPDEIVTKESTKFLESKQAVDDALAQLPGKYQAPEITKVYDEVIEKLQKTESPEANKWISMRSEYDKSGFDMSTINDLKRVYEREVKLGYNKLNNPDAVKLATNRDNALRNWQTKQADILGFENISEMNKQTQLAKFIADKLGDQIVGKSGLNGMSLTDWIMLSGGDPTAIGGLLTKKFFSDPGIQSRIAKMLSKVETKGMIKPKIGETKLPRLEPPKEKYFGTKVTYPINLPKETVTSAAKREMKNMGIQRSLDLRQKELPIGLPEPSGKAGIIELPEKGTFAKNKATKSGIIEVINARIKNPIDRRKIVKLIQDSELNSVIPEKPSQQLLKGKQVKKSSVSKASNKLGEKSKNLSTDKKSFNSATVPQTVQSYSNKKVIAAFDKSKKIRMIGKFELGTFGKNANNRKIGKIDRFEESELKETIKNIKTKYRASDNKESYRYDNTAWISEMPNGEKRVIYTRKNKRGNDEIINWHKISNEKYIETLKKF